MISFDPVSAAVILVMLGGLAAVVAEILVKSPRALLEIADDSRRFAEAPLAAAAVRAARPSAAAPLAAQETDQPRLAA